MQSLDTFVSGKQGNMKAQTKHLTSFVLNPKFILLTLAFLNVLAVPARYGRVCFYNWSDALGFAFLILVAALALWLSKWWSYVIGLVLTAPMLYTFGYEILKVHGVLPLTSEEKERYVTSEIWREIVWNHPEEFIAIVLAAIILCFSCSSLLRYVFSRRPALP